MADLSAASETARESNKLVLVIMGANWCHDSRSLASRINKEPLKTAINELNVSLNRPVSCTDCTCCLEA
jgi:hypothetical protein